MYPCLVVIVAKPLSAILRCGNESVSGAKSVRHAVGEDSDSRVGEYKNPDETSPLVFLISHQKVGWDHYISKKRPHFAILISSTVLPDYRKERKEGNF